MAGITTYHTYGFNAGMPGLLVDGNDLSAVVDSHVNDQSTVIDFGNAVAYSASTIVNGVPTTTCRAPTSTNTALYPIIGFAQHIFKQSSLNSGTVSYNQNEAVSVVKTGKFWARASENVVANDKVVCVMKGASAVSAVKSSGSNTGTGAITVDTTAPVDDTAISGIYKVRVTAIATNGFTASVTDPLGVQIGTLTLPGSITSGQSAYFNNQIKFGMADASTDYVVGDGFDITVTTGNGVLGGSSNNTTNGTATVTVTGSTAPLGSLVKDPTTPVLANAVTGNYTITCIALTSASNYTLRVQDPSGRVLGDIVIAGSLTSATFANQIKFTYTDGTDPTVGDFYTFAVVTNVNRIQLDGTLGNCHAVWDDTTANGQLGRVRIVRPA